jgi:hypothetical protein
MSSEDSDFIDDIVQDKLPEHMLPVRDRFLPWHRVRKEFIRSRQWNLLTERMVVRHWKRELQQPEHDWSLEDSPAENDKGFEPSANTFLKRPIKCLVIPGEDLLDLRALYRDLEKLNCTIRYLGFNESGGSKQTGTQVHISNNALTSLPRIWKDSMVVHDRFEALAHEDSQAMRYLKEYGPYHVVNLDLCGSMFPNTAKPPTEYYQALGEVLKFQCVRQNIEWLLFITTVVEPANVHVDELNKLCSPTRTNYDSHKDFAELLECLVPPSTFPTAPPPSIEVSELSEEQLVQLFGVAFGKWLLAFCHAAQPQWTVAMRRSFVYTMNEKKGAVMLSLAFELKPNITPPTDASGMTTTTQPLPKPFPTEVECANKLVESVANIRNVEDILANEPDLRSELRDAQARLLAMAGYDPEAYLKWVAEGEPSLSD